MAPINIKTACRTNGTIYGSLFSSCAASPASGGKITRPIVPKASCLPTSPLPKDVSRVAMTHAAPNNASAAVGQMSAKTLYEQKNEIEDFMNTIIPTH